MEQSTLTREEIERAARREGILHPVVTVIDYHAPTILQLNEEYSKVRSDNKKAQEYIRRNFGFLADSIEEANDFSLGSLDLVAIWSRAMEIFSGYQRYALSGMVSSAYGIRGVPNPTFWKGFPRYWLEKSELPTVASNDNYGLLHVENRLKEIGRNLDEFDFYRYGIRESPMELAGDLAKKSRDGDKEAEKQLNQLIAIERERKKEPTYPILYELHENFGNGMVSISLATNMALEKNRK